jgi:hypothetical protein
MEQAACQGDALGRREPLENFGLLVLRQIREDGQGIVGIELAYAFRHLLGRQFCEDLFADDIFDLGQRREIEVLSHQPDQLGTQLGLERLDQIADVSLVQVAEEFAQRRGIFRRDRLLNALDKIRAHRPSSSRSASEGTAAVSSFSSSICGLPQWTGRMRWASTLGALS